MYLLLLFFPLLNPLRSRLFRILRQILHHNSGREIVNELLAEHARGRKEFQDFSLNSASPYPLTENRGNSHNVFQRNDIIFLTGRFRSGSTLLWNVFRQLEGVTSFYEPFNERRWFDPETRGENVDGTHRQVQDYWDEYQGLEQLASYYREDWIRRSLYMDAGCWNGEMKRYIELMVEHASGRPVLQFNRIDFRLPWLRHYFPNAKIVHIFRHPRDQWCSTLQDISSFGAESGTFREFQAKDKFYLSTWVHDLKLQFPFLADDSFHPYQHYYWIWKLSYLFGQQFAHHSICFEELIDHPKAKLEPLLEDLKIEVENWNRIEKIFEKPAQGKWKAYAPEDWFQNIEAECEAVLDAYLGRSES